MLVKINKLLVVTLLNVFLITACNIENESIDNTPLDSTPTGDNTVTDAGGSSLPLVKPISEEEWKSQLNELNCLEGDYTITMHNHALGDGYDTDFYEVFEHTTDKWHLLTLVEESGNLFRDIYTARITENTFEEYERNSVNDKYDYIIINPSSDPDFHDGMDKNYYCYEAGVFLKYFAYNEATYKDDYYTLNKQIVDTYIYGNWKTIYTISEIKISFDSSKRLTTFANKVLIEKFYSDTLESSVLWTINGEFTSFDPVTIELPTNNVNV